MSVAAGAEYVRPRPAASGAKSEVKVVPVALGMLAELSSVRIYLPDDIRPRDKRKAVERSIKEVCRRFQKGGLPRLHPVDDLKVHEEGFVDLVAKAEALDARRLAHPLHSDPEREALLELQAHKEALAQEIAVVKRQVKQGRSIQKLDELKCCKRVLRRLGYCTKDEVIELKGRVACEVSSGDPLLITEMLFNGVFNDLTPAQCAALLSTFVFQEKTDATSKLGEELAGPLRHMQDSARRIARVSLDSKLPVDEEEYVQSFRPDLMDIVASWAAGARFADICKMTTIFEGSIIRAMRRLEELLRQMCGAAKVIGNTELENKFAEAITAIKRDIVFAASLYL